MLLAFNYLHATLPDLILNDRSKPLWIRHIVLDEEPVRLIGPIGDDRFGIVTSKGLEIRDSNGKAQMKLVLPSHIYGSSIARIDAKGTPVLAFVDLRDEENRDNLWRLESLGFQYLKYSMQVPWLIPSYNTSFAKINDHLFVGMADPRSFSNEALRSIVEIGDGNTDSSWDVIVALSDTSTKCSMPLLRLKSRGVPPAYDIGYIEGQIVALPKRNILAIISKNRTQISLLKVSKWSTLTCVSVLKRGKPTKLR